MAYLEQVLMLAVIPTEFGNLGNLYPLGRSANQLSGEIAANVCAKLRFDLRPHGPQE